MKVRLQSIMKPIYPLNRPHGHLDNFLHAPNSATCTIDLGRLCTIALINENAEAGGSCCVVMLKHNPGFTYIKLRDDNPKPIILLQDS